MYTGDYSIPRMIVRASEQPPLLGMAADKAVPPPDEPQESDSWASFGVRPKKAKKKSHLATAPTPLRTFRSLCFPPLKLRSNFEDTYEPYDGNEVSLHCTQTIKVAVFNGIRTSKERRGPLSLC
jgi:hypothetical protein